MTKNEAINALLCRYWFHGISEQDVAELLDENIAKANGNIEKGYLETDVILSLNCGSRRIFEPREVAILLSISAEQAGREYPNGLKASDIVVLQEQADTAV